MRYGEATNYIWNDDKYDRAIEAMGLKFDTKEECERAIERLKAFKRLKDKGFKFTDFNFPRLDKQATLNIYAEVKNECIYEDLLTLFGGEE